jgi:DNA ligase (NAD+)
MPDVCPNCGASVRIEGPRTYCPNRFGCSVQLKGRITHFASREGLDIEGLGGETAALLVERELVRDLADLFDLRMEDLLPLPGFAQKSAEKLVSSIQSRRKTELRRFLYGLGIPEVGAAVARDLALHFRDFDALRTAGSETLQEVPGVGPKMAEQILAFFTEPRIAEAVEAVHGKMTSLSVPAAGAEGGPFEGKKFVFTGGLDSMPRARAKKLVEDAGGLATSSVSGETDYVVSGEASGSKLEKARELGVAVLDEAAFLALLRDAGIEP